MENEERFQVLSKTAILVNLAAKPRPPFDSAKIEKNSGGGLVKLEKREDGLYVDGRKVILYLSKQQENGRMRGHKLREELSGKPVLHPNVMDALIEYPDLIPEDWKKDESKKTRYIFFWAVIFRHSNGDFYVRCLCFSGGEWSCFYRWLGLGWGARSPAALLES